MQAAIRIFGSYGFEGTSLRAIAVEAGLAFQLITYHFGSKEELWTAALNHLFDDRVKRARGRKFDPKGDLHAQLRDWIRETLSYAVEEPMLRRIFTQEYFENSDRYQRILKPKIEEFMAASGTVFQQLTELGIVSRFSWREVQLVLRSVIAANTIMPYEIQLTTGLPVSDPKCIDLQTELMFNLLVHGHGSLATQPAAPKRKRNRKPD